MTSLHAMTLDYLKTRKQFGVPIGSFQVLQHKAVDMFTALEQARSMEYYAAMMAELRRSARPACGDLGGQGADQQFLRASSARRRCNCMAASA